MKTTISRLISTAPLSLLLLIIAAACSPDRKELLSLVPDDIDFAITIDARRIASDAGCTMTDGKVTLPGYMEPLIRSHKLPEDFAERISEINSSVDLGNIVCYGYSNNPLTAFTITDSDIFESMLAEAESEKRDGFTIYRLNGSRATILTKDCTGWITEARNPVKTITEAADKAKTAPITKHPGLNDALTASNPINIIYDPSLIDSSLGEHWLTISGKIESETLLITAKAVTPDGETMTINSMQEISTDFLRYVPSDFQFAAAAGLTSGINWDGFATLIGMAAGYRSRGMVDTLLPYLKSIDGTVAIAAGTADSDAWTDFDPEHWHLIAMVHMPQEKINQATSQVAMLLSQMRMPVKNTAPGRISADFDGTTYTVGNVDGYFTIASIPMEPVQNNSLTTSFTGKQAAAVISIPSLQPYLGSRGTFGMNLQLAVERQETTLKINLTDTDRPILETLLPLILDLELI